jgi:hypothetical protein
MRAERPPYILIALLLGSGGYLLLRNFRLLPEVDLTPYAPLLLVLLGVQLLLRGDLGISWAAQPLASRAAQCALPVWKPTAASWISSCARYAAKVA